MSDLATFFSNFNILTVAEWLDLEVTGAGGGRGKICCPITGEKTPSFHLYPEDGHFYCFGCQASGSIADLVMVSRNISFGEALDFLAEHGDVERPTQDPEQAARASSWRKLREAFREGLELTPAEKLPAGLDHETAAGLGLGRAVDIAGTVAELARPVLTSEEAAAWEGNWTLELQSRGGVAGIGAFLPTQADFDAPRPIDPRTARFVRAGGARGALLAGRSAAGEAIRASDAVLITPDPAELLEMHAAGYHGSVSTLGPIGEPTAKLLADLEVRLVLVASAERRADGRRFMADLAALLATGRNVSIAARRPDGSLAPAVPLFAYLAAVATRMDAVAGRRFLDAMIGVLPSPSTRALWRAEADRRGIGADELFAPSAAVTPIAASAPAPIEQLVVEPDEQFTDEILDAEMLDASDFDEEREDFADEDLELNGDLDTEFLNPAS